MSGSRAWIRGATSTPVGTTGTLANRTHRSGSRIFAFPLLFFFFLIVEFGAPATALEGDPQKGEKVFQACKSCHQVGSNARNGVGPHLDGLFGRTAGSLNGFQYSNAMKARGKDGLVWDASSLFTYLQKPNAFVPGTRMSFRGMASQADRRNVIAYLQSVSRQAPSQDPTVPSPSHPEIGGATMALEGDRDYGKYLASECVTCHQITGHADGIPSIIGWPKSAFVRALFEYKTNVRSHLVMQNITANLGNEEIAALAAYFGSIAPQ